MSPAEGLHFSALSKPEGEVVLDLTRTIRDELQGYSRNIIISGQ